MNYRVNEIFESIQGEGTFSGTWVTFVRFAGCNMRCSFCDTEFDSYTEMTAEEINAKIKTEIVVFTGGEPFLQLNQEFVSYIRLSHSVHVETNGSIDNFITGINHLVVSPKDPFRWNIKNGDDLKILIGKDDSDMPLIDILQDTYFDNYLLQPIMGEDYPLALDNCLLLIKKHPRWRLSLQIHKYRPGSFES